MTPSPQAATEPSERSSKATFERKVRLSRWAMLLERMWPRVWLLIGIAAVFLIISLAGIWPGLSEMAHIVTLAAFALAALAAFGWLARVRWPAREEALRRMERASGLPHRPASSYEDTLSAASSDPATQSIWQAHRSRLAAMLSRLKVGTPRPRTDRLDPLALRALVPLSVIALLGLVGDGARDRLASAFRFGPSVNLAEARLDAWVTPPAYTGKPPILLADGSRGAIGALATDAKAFEVPERSLLIARSSGTGGQKLRLEFKPADGSAAETISAPEVPAPVPGAASNSDISEVRLDLRKAGSVRLMSGRSELATYNFTVVQDQAPKIVMTKDPERTLRGAMKLHYKVEDDYGVASAEARFQRLPPGAGDPRTLWARSDHIKGPRLPLERPPVLGLRLPRSTAQKKDNETWSFHEVGSHPWAGSRVRMTLVAKDHAGNVGRSQPHEFTLPQRHFSKPLAKAVIEQRRKLVEDSRHRPMVVKAIDALTFEPEDYIQDRRVYLGMRSVYHRLIRDKSRAGINSSVEQLWHIAVRIEDGSGLTDAERRLRELQEQLSKAIQDGASDEELKRLMQELRQALNEFMQQLQRQAENMPPMEFSENFNPSQTVRPEDLERMLNNIENMARQGSRDTAQDMLSQLRDLLEQLQSGRMANQGQQGQQNRQMMQMMDELGNIIGQQQQLLDDTFGEQQRQGDGEQPGQQQGQQGQRGQQGQQGQRGQRPGQQGQRGQGQQGQGQRGQQPGQGQGETQQGQQQGQSPGQGRGPLGQRQQTLRDQLGQLQQRMRERGMQPGGQLSDAQEAMENARRMLEQGDLDGATREEQRALEQLRQGAQQMAQQMLRQRQQQGFGPGPAADAPRDPLGRPQRSEGPDLNTNVQIPSEIETQRAREILEELRRRLGETQRPTIELDYIERLLRRF